MRIRVALLLCASLCVFGQAVKPSRIARLADGHPDLQGVWTNATLTPFQRPAELGTKEFFTKEEAAAFAQQRMNANNLDAATDDGTRGPADLARRAYNSAWMDRGTSVSKTMRTSLIVEPADGRIPPMTPRGKEKYEASLAQTKAHPSDGPEDRMLSERCVLFPNAGPPMLPEPYNNNYQIVQTHDDIAIMAEMIHDVRHIYTDGRPHLPNDIRQWKGDSRGRWQGDTLIVETTNFTFNHMSRFGVVYNGMTDENLHVLERFTPQDANTILYRATVADPTIYTKPWTVEYTLSKRNDPIYEYACHEGNYGMFGILSGERAQEKAKK